MQISRDHPKPVCGGGALESFLTSSPGKSYAVKVSETTFYSAEYTHSGLRSEGDANKGTHHSPGDG